MFSIPVPSEGLVVEGLQGVQTVYPLEETSWTLLTKLREESNYAVAMAIRW
jgi:predicted DNA-binding ribbon-helix-helix protein